MEKKKNKTIIEVQYSMESLPEPTILTQESVFYNGQEIFDNIFMLD